MTAYYNEIDPYAAQWIRNLIAAGHIAAGDVDERSIEDVKPDELMGYTQCHFFAGVGVWSYALRQAGFPDDRQVWTGSCPCQPFSTAGKGTGFNDERHLWPHFQWLIQQCQPATVFGEQVASKTTEPWIDLVHADLEALGYAFGCVPFPSAGVGAPHIRDRAYWVAHASNSRRQFIPIWPRVNAARVGAEKSRLKSCYDSADIGGLGNANGQGPQRHAGDGGAARREGPGGSVAAPGLSGGMADTEGVGECPNELRRDSGEGVQLARTEPGGYRGYDGSDAEQKPIPGPTNGFWKYVDWLGCRDGKWRPVEPGTFPLAYGAPARVGRLRAYGNAINAYQAQIFIESAMEAAA